MVGEIIPESRATSLGIRIVNGEGEEEPLVVASGRVVDFDLVAAKIKEICKTFDVKEIAFDPALARDVQKLTDADNLPSFDFPQRPSTMMPAIAELEKAIVNRQLQWGGHPIIRFCFANAEVERTRLGDSKAFKKSHDWLSIDGTVAAAMAILRASDGEDVPWWSAHLDHWRAEKAANQNADGQNR
jgi:phage terminase large subunit-like protein